MYLYIGVFENMRYVFTSETPQSIEELRSEEPRVVEVAFVDMQLSSSRPEIQRDIEQLSGVVRVEFFGAAGEFTVQLSENSDWTSIRAGIQRIIAEVLEVNPRNMVITEFAYASSS